jgi:hypothetical protein
VEAIVRVKIQIKLQNKVEKTAASLPHWPGQATSFCSGQKNKVDKFKG